MMPKKMRQGLKLFTIYESLARSILENELDHQFTELEIKRVQFALNDAGRSYGGVLDLITDAGVDALDNSKGQWDEFDRGNVA